jgi:hypothetical protein
MVSAVQAARTADRRATTAQGNLVGAAIILAGMDVEKKVGLFNRSSYAVDIFFIPAAGVKSNWESRFLAELSNRPRCSTAFRRDWRGNRPPENHSA